MFHNADPKPQPKQKKVFGTTYWNNIKKKSLEKKKMKIAPITQKDDKFYEYLWKKRGHRCAECGNELREMKKHNFHHKLPKRNGFGGHPYFRHEEKNVIILCWSCHQKAESQISYPKMKIYEQCEKDKRLMLESIGL